MEEGHEDLEKQNQKKSFFLKKKWTTWRIESILTLSDIEFEKFWSKATQTNQILLFVGSFSAVGDGKLTDSDKRSLSGNIPKWVAVHI